MPPQLPERALDTTAESPWPVRTLSRKIADYVEKMAPVWVEGQVMQLSRRGGTCYLTLRDPEVDMSLSVTTRTTTLDAMGPGIAEGTRVVVHAKPSFWTKRGTLVLDARRIRHVGVGELLARVEHLRQVLRSEGLFDPERKRVLPFLPRTVGLITGRGSAAEKDVVTNARRRWPAVRFEIREVAVQGPTTVTEVTAALRELDELDVVDVVVIARGGGSVEDLLPFSNEALLRAVAAARTPVVSAIGHDVDSPLLDHVADVRASTPTDAARRVVPDLAEQQGVITGLRRRGDWALRRRVHEERRSLPAPGRSALALRRRLEHERHRLEAACSRPAFADRSTYVTLRRREVDALSRRSRARTGHLLERDADRLAHLRAQVRLLSPAATLERGYAVLRRADGTVVTDPAQVAPGDRLLARLAGGELPVTPLPEEG